jgi:indole-3-glycerol phosphate synthase
MNILDKIVAVKREEVARLPQRAAALENLKWSVKSFGARRDFMDALRYPRVPRLSLGPSEGERAGVRGRKPIALIAEVKKASPSAGVIRSDFDPVRIAQEYEAAGASCLSVLTDEQFFQGSLKFLQQIRDSVKLPLLRKDFIIHERQILESIEAGADAILLIVAILTDDELRRFHALARGAGLAALVEVHDAPELHRALAAGAELIGVNNRDLKTFTTDLATTETLAPLAVGKLLVAESGIHTRADVQRLERCGAQAILVGESLMRSDSISAKISELLQTRPKPEEAR